MSFPDVRLRRLRRSEALRRLVRDTRLDVGQLVMPLFVRPGSGERRHIDSMPGNHQLSVDELVKECQEVAALGISAILLFGIPSSKDAVGSEGYADDGIVQQAVRALKESVPDLLVVTDVCLCEYSDHGHCGVIRDGEVDNDATLDLLARMAVSHARAGADVVAPSDMMDGRVGAVRSALDGEGFDSLPIMAYSAKYASHFYGPFRDAAESPRSSGTGAAIRWTRRTGTRRCARSSSMSSRVLTS
jgi:porphobilinogen synthase